MDQSYTTRDKRLQGEFLSNHKSFKNWAEVAAAVREKIKRLENVATAFERYRDTNEPFIGESVRAKRQRKVSREEV